MLDVNVYDVESQKLYVTTSQGVRLQLVNRQDDIRTIDLSEDLMQQAMSAISLGERRLLPGGEWLIEIDPKMVNGTHTNVEISEYGLTRKLSIEFSWQTWRQIEKVWKAANVG